MPKFTYPADGLYNRCSGSVERSSKNLAGAISHCNFDIPSDFPYKNYLYGLDEKLRNYYQEISDIKARIRKIDSNFRALSNQSENSAARLIVSKINRRERMIK